MIDSNNVKEMFLNNYQETLESFILSIKNMEESNEYLSIISAVDECYDYLTEEDKKTLINYKIRSLIRLSLYNELIETTKTKKKLNLTDEELAYTLFYESIAYEYLGEYEYAINSLNDIIDSIKSEELTNKYLKLAILYLKTNNLTKAKESYDYASKIDHFKRNSIFYLVESDLFYASKKYYEALSSYELFYLKNPNKYRYLDRYILINIKLNNLTDAYDFYVKYKDDKNEKESIGYLDFLNASKELLILLDKKDEVNEINSILDNHTVSYNNKTSDENINIINSLIKSSSYPLTKYDRRKNIVNRIKRELNDKLNILYYIEENEDSISFNKFDQVQARETKYTYSFLKENNILDKFIFEEDTIVDNFYNEKLEPINSKLKIYLIKNDIYNFGYIVTSYIKENDVLFDALRNVLLEVFIRLDAIVNTNKTFNSLVESLSEKGIGFIKLSNNNIEFVNSYSRSIFNTSKDYLDFVVFKDYFIDNVYIDSFVKEEPFILKVLVNEKKKVLEFDSIYINNELYSFIKDVTDSIDLTVSKEEFYLDSNNSFYNENKLKDIINSIDESYSIIGLNINYLEAEDTLTTKQNKLKKLYDFLDKRFNDSSLFYLGENHYLILFNTVDKRNLESYFNKINKEIYPMFKESICLKEKPITGFASKSLKNKTVDEVFKLIEYGFAYSNRKEEFIILDNDSKRAYQVYNTFEYQIVKHIKEHTLQISYMPIVKESTREIFYLYPAYSSIYDFNYEAIESIIYKNNIQAISDELILINVINNKKKFNAKFRYVIDIHDESLLSTTFVNKVCDLIIKNGLINIVTLRVNHIPNKALDVFKKANIKLAKTIDSISFEEVENFNTLFVELKNENIYNKAILNTLKDTLNKEIIVINDNNEFINDLTFKRMRVLTVEDLSKYS